jgi:hypothetical protein
LLSALLAVLFLLLTCCSYLVEREEAVPNRPATRTFTARATVVRKALERVLTTKHFTVDAEQSLPLRILTCWLQDGPYRSKLKADLEPGPQGRQTRLTLYLILEKKVKGRDEWQTVDEINKMVYDDFMEDVAMEIYRVIYDGA